MIEICIGSACHIKGSYQVIQEMKRLLQEHKLTAKVELKSAFCLGKCGEGVSVRLNNETVYKVDAAHVEEFFLKYILEEVKQ